MVVLRADAGVVTDEEIGQKARFVSFFKMAVS
jgi:hypothetical protein